MEGEPRPALRRFAVLAAAMTLVLILAGGFVTTTRTGDTIETWPTWGRLEGGAWVEAGHRLLAIVVGLLVAGLTVWLLRSEPRPWLRRLVLAAAAAVIVQALLGGARVYRLFPAGTAIVHATLAQLVFCAMTALAVALSRTWSDTPADDRAAEARGIGAWATSAAFLQLVAGAVTRHTGAGLPVHVGGALAVLLLVSLFASRLMLTPLRKGARVLMALLGLQVVLGAATWAITANGFVRSHESPLAAVVAVTAHVALGALLLAATLVLTLMCHRSKAAAPEPALA